MSCTIQHLKETAEIVSKINPEDCEKYVRELVSLRTRHGRLFILGVGGSAANASHAVNDFRKIAGLECYAPTDNVSELTARTNDEGWASVFVEWLRGSPLTAKVADACVIAPTIINNVTPHLEAFQAMFWHLFVSHPDLKLNQKKWESVAAQR